MPSMRMCARVRWPGGDSFGILWLHVEGGTLRNLFSAALYPCLVVSMAICTVWMVTCAPKPEMSVQELERAKADSITQECRNHGGKPVKELDGVRVFCDYKR